MMDKERLFRLSPWAVVTLIGCASLTAVDLWRDQGPTSFHILRGTLPNLVAVPTLTFGFLMVRFPDRCPFEASLAASQARWFWGLWASALVVTVAWEFAQRAGPLVFDPLDLYATVAGAGVAVALFFVLRRISFLPAV